MITLIVLQGRVGEDERPAEAGPTQPSARSHLQEIFVRCVKEMTKSAEFKEIALKGRDKDLSAFSIHSVAT